MNRSLGDVQVASVAVATEDAGAIVGVALIFESTALASEFMTQVGDYYETPPDKYKEFSIRFKDRGDLCDVEIHIVNINGTTSIIVEGERRAVLDNVLGGLAERPYYFLVPCTAEEGQVIPYAPRDNLIVRGYVEVDNETHFGNRQGRWPKTGNPFG